MADPGDLDLASLLNALSPQDEAEAARAAAAQRMRQAAQPPGGRQEGPATRFLSNVVPALFGDVLPDMAGRYADYYKTPGNVLNQSYVRQPETPGMWSEADEHVARANADEVGRRGRVMAMDAFTGGMPFAKQGAAGIFGGKLAQTADHKALAKAEEMAAGGAPREAIWDATGWFQGVDGKWRFEIPDYDARTQVWPMGTVNRPLDKTLTHDALFRAYPDMQQNMVMTDRKLPGGARAQYKHSDQPQAVMHELTDKPVNIMGQTQEFTSDQRNILLHEIQHGVQRREGFEPGSSPSYESRFLTENTGNPIIEQLRSKISAGEFGGPGDKMFTDAARKLLTLEAQSRDKRAMEAYTRNAGEVEARNVELRSQYTPSWGRKTPPWVSQSVPDQEQIVRALAGGNPASVKMPPGWREIEGGGTKTEAKPPKLSILSNPTEDLIRTLENRSRDNPGLEGLTPKQQEKYHLLAKSPEFKREYNDQFNKIVDDVVRTERTIGTTRQEAEAFAHEEMMNPKIIDEIIQKLRGK